MVFPGVRYLHQTTAVSLTERSATKACLPFKDGSSYAFFLVLAGNMEPVALTVAGTSIQTTGSAEQKGTPTTWLVLLASPAKDSCPQEKSSLWWMRGFCVVCTMTACWTTSNAPWRMVRRLTLYTLNGYFQAFRINKLFIPSPFI